MHEIQLSHTGLLKDNWDRFMSAVSPVFHTEVIVSIDIKTSLNSTNTERK